MLKLLLSVLLSSTNAHTLELPANVAKVYNYQCETTFLEGEGAKATELDCTPFQQLGLLSARYNYYFFRSPAGSNENKRAGDAFYPETACNLQLLQTHCKGKDPELRFGLSTVKDDTFSVPVNLSPAPGRPAELHGYAAVATKGKCAAGLLLVQVYRAKPKTISKPLPTSFVNTNGNLDDILAMAPGKNTPRFEINRMRNNQACDDSGSCSSALFDTPAVFQRVDYKAGLAVCVIPKSAFVSGTFP